MRSAVRMGLLALVLLTSRAQAQSKALRVDQATTVLRACPVEPAPVPTCEPVNPTSSALVRQAATAYAVLPPPTGAIVPDAFTLTDNIRFCGQMLEVQATSRALSASIAQVLLSTSATEQQLAELRSRRASAERRAAEHAGYRSLERQADDLEDEREERLDRADDLTAAYGCPGATCPSDVASEISALRAESASLANEVATLRSRAVSERQAYELARSEASALSAQIDSVQSALDAELDALVVQRNQLLALYRQYAALHGLDASFLATTRWRENIDQLSLLNTGRSFSAVRTRDARLDLALVPGIGSDSYLASLPAVLGYRIGGSLLDPADPTRTLPTFPEQLRVDVLLSLVAACAQADPTRFDIEQAVAGGPIYAINVSYEYAMERKRSPIIRYNSHLLYLLLAKYATSGFVQRKQLPTLSTLPAQQSGVEIAWPAEDVTPQAERARIERSIHDELLDDALRLFAEAHYDADLPFIDGGPDPLLAEPSLMLPSAASLSSLGALTKNGGYAQTLEKAYFVSAETAPKNALAKLGVTVERTPESTAVEPAIATAAVSVASKMRPIDAPICLRVKTPTAVIQTKMTIAPTCSVQKPSTAAAAKMVVLPAGVELSATEKRLVVDALGTAQRLANPLCGNATFACEGIAFGLRARPLGQVDASKEERLRRAFDVWKVREPAPDLVVYRPGLSLFTPIRR